MEKILINVFAFLAVFVPVIVPMIAEEYYRRKEGK